MEEEPRPAIWFESMVFADSSTLHLCRRQKRYPIFDEQEAEEVVKILVKFFDLPWKHSENGVPH